VQRRFWEAKEGRQNRVEIVAEYVASRPAAEGAGDD
jgi:hypothetical protein